MKRKSFKSLLATAVAVCTLVGNVCPAMAAETQEVSGSGAQSKDVKVTAEINSVYSVSLPATIDLEYSVLENRSFQDVAGYWYRLKYGVAGRISSSEKVYVEPVYPCEISIVGDDGQIQATLNVTDFTHSDECYGGGNCKTEWTSSEVGSCTYNGTTISDCVYSNCCNDGHWIGVKAADVTEYGSYEGNLTFNFGIR